MNKIFSLEIAKELVSLMDNKFSLFGFRFGLDPILGLIPGVGDALPAIAALYMVGVGLERKMPISQIIVMLFNIFLDFFLGSVPIIGDLFDFFFQAHSKNYKLLTAFLSDE